MTPKMPLQLHTKFLLMINYKFQVLKWSSKSVILLEVMMLPKLCLQVLLMVTQYKVCCYGYYHIVVRLLYLGTLQSVKHS